MGGTEAGMMTKEMWFKGANIPVNVICQPTRFIAASHIHKMEVSLSFFM